MKAGGIGSVSVVGGGVGRIELAFAIDHRFRQEAGEAAPHVRILTSAHSLVPEYSAAVRARFIRLARRRNIGTHAQSFVTEVGGESSPQGQH